MAPGGATGTIRRSAAAAGDRSAHLDVRREDPRAGAAADGAFRCRQLLADLLWAAWPREAERRADALIGEFGSLPALLAADPAAVTRCLGEGGEGIAAFLATVRGAQLHSLRREIEDGPLLPTSAALLDYLHVRMAWTADEQFRVLYLNSRNRLLRDEIVATGTPNEVTVHPRAIVKRALEVSATALILVHNHPSGSPDPSQSDIQTTARIVRAAKTLDIVVHDHIIVARSGWRSFRQSGLLV
ncbi:MAG TPA: DNA repair protein RadC [Allosphingosinicella sp.]|nr:DNA repair protein RadC [Allosphingosinicella sp.]